MRNDPDGVRNPLLEQDPRRNGRRRRSTLLISISVLAAIGGSWSGWQLRNQNSQAAITRRLDIGLKVFRTAEATALASFGSPYGAVPKQAQSEAVTDENEASLASELAKRAAGAQLVAQGSTDTSSARAPAADPPPVSPPANVAAPAPAPAPQPVAAMPSPSDDVAAAVQPSTASPGQAADPPSERLPQQVASIANVAPSDELSEPPALPSSTQMTPAEPPAAASAEPPPVPDISVSDQQQMLLRVRPMLQDGDIAGARLILERLDAVGNGRATLYLAETYDPIMLNRWGVIGIAPDAEKATELYRRALAEGVPEARQHLAASVSQQP